MVSITRGYVAISYGQIHYAQCGDGDPILLLHQTPRSWDEYLELLPLLGRRYRAIALDTPGYGNSDPSPDLTVESFSDGIAEAAKVMNLKPVAIVGHHTGAVIALDLATRYKNLVSELILSSTPYLGVDSDGGHDKPRPPRDRAERTKDGSYLRDLWAQRADFYPDDEPVLLERYVVDALRAGIRSELGHRAVARFDMAQIISAIHQPVLLIGAAKDPFSFPDFEIIASKIPLAERVVIADGMVPLMEREAENVARLVVDFLARSRE